jgi:hypothetical protein
LYENFELKDKLANQYPYHEFVKKIIRIDKRITSKKENKLFDFKSLRQRKIACRLYNGGIRVDLTSNGC